MIISIRLFEQLTPKSRIPLHGLRFPGKKSYELIIEDLRCDILTLRNIGLLKQGLNTSCIL